MKVLNSYGTCDKMCICERMDISSNVKCAEKKDMCSRRLLDRAGVSTVPSLVAVKILLRKCLLESKVANGWKNLGGLWQNFTSTRIATKHTTQDGLGTKRVITPCTIGLPNTTGNPRGARFVDCLTKTESIIGRTLVPSIGGI